MRGKKASDLAAAGAELCLRAQRQPAFGLKWAKKSVEIVRRVARSRLCRADFF